MNLCIMISGGGRTMMNLLRECREGRLDANVALVIASSMCKGVELARREGVATIVMPDVIAAPTLKQTLDAHKIDIVALAGYLKFLNVPAGYEGRIVNIHPALLPKYGGKGMYGHHVHEAVVQAKESVSGCTVHLVDGEYDHGSILLQRTCAVRPDDTAESLAARVFEQETLAYPHALQLLLASLGKR